MVKLLFYIICLAFTLDNIAVPGTIDPNIPDIKYIEYGKDFHCIGKVLGKMKNGLDFNASGIAIEPHFVLTAAHVVEEAEHCYFVVKDKKISINKVVYHNHFNVNKIAKADIALGYCEEDFGLDFYPELYSTEDEVGKTCSISGYGFTGNFITGANTYDDKRRAGSNIIDSIDRDLLICSPSKKYHKTSLEFIIASGDSGGGLFVDGKLAGINSCVITRFGTPKSDYNTESGHTRISQYIEWIRDNIKTIKQK